MTSSRPAVASRRILIVDGHSDTLSMFATLLVRRGHHVQTAATLGQARRLCHEDVFDVVVCELRLPDGSGLDLARELRNTCPEARLIALTTSGTPDDIDAAMNAGFHIHLLKPLDIQTFLRELAPPTTSTAASVTP